MPTYNAVNPTQTGADAGPAITAALTADRISVGDKALFVFENTGSAVTVTLEDVRSQQQAGAPASTTFADLQVNIPGTDRVAVRINDTSRFKDPTTGLIALTFSGVTGVTYQVYDIS